MDRPKLLATMRFVDDDRSGLISFDEFRWFCMECIEEHKQKAQVSAVEFAALVTNNGSSRSGDTSQDQRHSHRPCVSMQDRPLAELEEMETSLLKRLEVVRLAKASKASVSSNSGTPTALAPVHRPTEPPKTNLSRVKVVPLSDIPT